MAAGGLNAMNTTGYKLPTIPAPERVGVYASRSSNPRSPPDIPTGMKNDWSRNKNRRLKEAVNTEVLTAQA
ncbi:hypothetical protein SAMN06265222_104225 [Neorhodopirellula lusitana]|uniref:Uncharacterized protein n=1 Tax=Neorhodopirellula lusitana TaxID=445327 RepID=A0ABY1PZJ6_9BACT|nr:hypothetical protein SAMN06265222_104225 [Neorhodopirellula lusitana]